MQTQTSQSLNGMFKRQNMDKEMIKELIFSELRINHFTYNISLFFLNIFTCRFGIPYAEPAARVHSVEVAVWWLCACMQMFSQVYCIHDDKKCKRKTKTTTKSNESLRIMSVYVSHTLVCVHVWHVVILNVHVCHRLFQY